MSGILQIFHAAIAAADPFRTMRENLALENGLLRAGEHIYHLDDFERILVAGAGKAGAGMGLAVESILADRISAGLLILPNGAGAPLRYITCLQGGHPLPDEGSRRASGRILELLAGADEKTLVLFLVSGGASALLAVPAPGVALAEKNTVTSLLLGCGAAIDELNAVRKHLSTVKGGRLAAAAFPAAVLTLAVSDVIGDRPDVIGSGPTVADNTTFADARAVIEKYRLQDKIPARVRKFLEHGLAGQEKETIKPGDLRLGRSTFVVIGNNARALDGARTMAKARGWQAEVSASPVQGEARIAARSLAVAALKAQAGLQPGEKRCLLCGGETTVSVLGKGRGGRNQELALAFALEIAGRQGIELLSAGTDGVDGPTDAAGAIVDGATVAAAAALGLDVRAYLNNNDSYGFFSELDRLGCGQHHLKTGPTGTNVMDLQVILLRHPG
jgi:glycerate 2-kinase